VGGEPSPHWYFAYGSNLAPERLRERTRGDVAGLPCRLPGHRLAFNKRSSRRPGWVFANIVPACGAEVWGVAYRCTAEALAALDVHEGVAGGNYVRHPVQVLTREGNALAAVTYIAGPEFVCGEAPPQADYLAFLLDGARHHGLPAGYIEALARQAVAGAPPAP
jgi:gamma-glutamylcyclotransferase